MPEDFVMYKNPDDPSYKTVDPDTFSVRWTSTPIFTAATHQFTAGADDGIRVYIDGTLVIDQWHQTAYTEYTATRVLTAGAHDITVEYFESLGAAKVKLAWAEVPANTSAGRIAFRSNRDDVLNSDIYIMDANGGTDVQRLTTDPAYEDFPAWSPDGTQIVFASYRDGDSDLYVMDADGGNVEQLTDVGTGAWDHNPTWSPDGTRIAFRRTLCISCNSYIYVMDADGGNVHQPMDAGNWSDTSPTWSPDGTRIAFARFQDGYAALYVMGADGTNVQQLTDVPGIDDSPAWSPDGTRIAFRSNRDGDGDLDEVGDDGDFDIYVMDTDGGNLKQLTDVPGVDYKPTWSPDSSRIAFASNRDGDFDLFIMDAASGGNVTNLTKHLAVDFSPAWAPG
jgi:Tol biopolymer transport system component